MVEITKEYTPDASIIPPLDHSLLKLSEQEEAFLQSAITTDKDALREKLFKVQKESYAAYPYPCIRAFHFVWLMMVKNAIYPKVLEAGKKGDTVFLDIGCCMGTDVRKLVQDGYPAENVLGSDLRQEFIDLGHELYADKGACPITFFSADIFDAPDAPAAVQPSVPLREVKRLGDLHGRVSHLYSGALFHLFNEPTQYAMALRVAYLLKRTSGAIVFGRHQGKEEEGLIDDHMTRVRYGHSPSSWKRLWKEVFTQVESAEFAEKRVVVDATLEGSHVNVNNPNDDSGMLYWSVSIV